MIGLELVGFMLLIQALRWWISPKKNSTDPTGIGSPIPSVTFLVAAWNAELNVEPFIRSFSAITGLDKQLVLCAGGSDGTLGQALSYNSDTIIVVEQDAIDGKQQALKKALEQAWGDIIYLTDIDCRLEDDSVKPVVQYVADHPDRVATGTVRPLESQMGNNFVLMQWAIREQSNGPDGSLVGGIDGRNAAMARSILQTTRVLNVPAPSGTDYTLAKELLRLGYSIYFIEGSRMQTEFPKNLTIYIQKQARWLRNVYVLGKRYGAQGEVRRVTLTLAFPFGAVMGLIASILVTNLFWLPVLLILYSLSSRALYLHRINRPRAVASCLSVLVGDWAAALLTVRHLYRGDLSWS